MLKKLFEIRFTAPQLRQWFMRGLRHLLALVSRRSKIVNGPSSRVGVLALVVSLSMLAMATPVHAEVDGQVATSEGVVLLSDSEGKVDVTLEHWDSTGNEYELVESTEMEVGEGTYFHRFGKLTNAGGYRVTLSTDAGDETLRFDHKSRTFSNSRLEDFLADSAGASILLSSKSSTLAKARALLIDDSGRVIETLSFSEKSQVTGTLLEKPWGVPLKEGEGYDSLALYTNDGTTSGEVSSFTAERDAAVSALSPDENGATVTVAGESQVPLNGTVELVLKSEGETLERFEEPVKEVTAGEERSKTVYWDEVLNPGTYSVEATLDSGRVLDAETESFEVDHDAAITDAFGAAVGASVTVKGRSDLPLKGDVVVELSREGEVVRTETMPAPVVLSGNEESVDTEWESRLQPGSYVLVAELSTEEGVVDRYGTTFQTQSVPDEIGNESAGSGGSDGGGPMSKMPAAGAVIALLALLLTLQFTRR